MGAHDIQFAGAMSTALTLLVGALLANLPFAVALGARAHSLHRALGWLAGFAAWQAEVFVFGRSVSSLAPQAWGETIAVGFLLYAVLGFPAFVWRFLR
ncbi:MAG: hypothetical protein KGQ57_21145 [Burkholderiales bacterium]|nr:hypothetical protein [Burkholderiales bacterium]